MTQIMGKKIKDMVQGEGFGEKALTSKDAVRTTSILTNEITEFLVLSKDDYLNTINKHDKSRAEKQDFMKKYIPFLDKINSP
eukprot:CAMPEP_0114582464 /NCGR_PEP_ID=MMETSP0125-20121206/6441_1 /TAXON_ID=485358 ORGANISM="Aristerostoma sp., Strain ATCC 50986" /NCGR_SAMPLE_ID=MMETSP0125 /ASSEMBLY_ACC=CAM_ASM_000245 /LENGTH=81 /DNA_ID=CAMNT_0001775435 /DNA_START=515 /DNA_END=760 /DNA_ORIENTATION=-